MIEFTRKIGRNRGKPRLWIEGKHLTAAGLLRGDRITFRQWADDPRQFVLMLDYNGDRKVSGKGDKPIIDIAGTSLGALGEASKVSIGYELGSGILWVVAA